MPYISQWRREVVDGVGPQDPGELNYAITKLVMEWVYDQGGVSYSAINEAIGVLECAKLELYRRIAGPYEDVKLTANGDVY